MPRESQNRIVHLGPIGPIVEWNPAQYKEDAMATVTKDFSSYFLSYTSPYHQMGGARLVGNISCYLGEATVGQLLFYTGAVPVPSYGNDMIFLTFSIDRFHDIYDIVRNEKPLVLWFDLDNNLGSLMTKGFEPVGEQEGHPIAPRPRRRRRRST